MTPKDAMEIGMNIAIAHQTVVLETARYFPDQALEQLLHGNSVWLGTQIMKALCPITTGDIGAGHG